jgi:AcrR family transcriptional regulator
MMERSTKPRRAPARDVRERNAGAPRDEGESGDRRSRRREATRRSLMEAARRLFAGKGVEATRINEITEDADVGFGSFYNHFDSKDAIARAVLAEAVAAQGAELDTLTAELEDPAEVISVAHRYFVARARADPDWGWLLVRLDVSHNIMLEALGPLARRDLARGIRAGRLQVANKRTALFAAGGALLAVMRAVLDGQAPKAVDRYHAEGVLRLFGLSAQDAEAVASRPMPATRA